MQEKYTLSDHERDQIIQALCLQLSELKDLYDTTQKHDLQFPFRTLAVQKIMGFELQRTIDENKKILTRLGSFVDITITPKPRPGGESYNGNDQAHA